jgi:outer membrane protein assembly factor BamB
MDSMQEPDAPSAERLREAIGQLVFVGFNSRVAALHRDTGEVMWQWTSRQGTSSYVALLLDGEQLVVSVHGYTYCLNPLTGEELWFNPLSGFGVGIPSIVSIRGSSAGGGPALKDQQDSSAAAG